jgi:hypothetical protein
MSAFTDMSRRRVLRGVLNGGAVTVGLPLLNVFLNGNATAMADGAKLPVRFGTWSWGLGLNKAVFVPKKTGANFDLPEEIASLKDVQKHINLFTNFDGFKDANPNLCHKTGWVIMRAGAAPANQTDLPGESIDVTIAKEIAGPTRFQTLTATSTGNVRDSFSYESATSINPAEVSPLLFYAKLFGEDFQNPNAPEFKPSPRVMVRKGVLSGVMDRTKDLTTKIGSEDKARLDQYFTGLRELERQFDLALTKPEPRAACVVNPGPKNEVAAGLDYSLVGERHKLMTDLIVMALACDQTRVYNLGYAAAFSGTIKPGYEKPHHTATHEEPLDPVLGYQVNCSWFIRRQMEAFAYHVKAMADFKEGDGALIDNMLIYATTDQSLARLHQIDGLPMFLAGRAGGKLKTGIHVDGNHEAATRVGYTAMKVFGLDVPSWGEQSNKTSKEVSEILA